MLFSNGKRGTIKNRSKVNASPDNPVRMLAADDDSVIREMVSYYAVRSNIRSEIFDTGDKLLERLDESIQVCLLDLDMPGSSGMDCLATIKKQFPSVEVIILTSNQHANDAIAAIKAGAFDYVTKPFDPDELINCIRNAMLLNTKQRENLELRSSVTEGKTTFSLLGESPAMKRIFLFVERISVSQSPVLVTGESGTGKTLLARQIHASGPSPDGPFICVSCPSIPHDLLESEMFGHEKGAFSGAAQRKLGKAELANGGTLFLDEVGDMPLHLQAKLLTFLQNKTFYRVGGEKLLESETRIIAATNKNLPDLVSQGLFREDLYFRLNVLPVEMPPLRKRLTDLPLLYEHFVQDYALNAQVPLPLAEEGLVTFLEKYSWPGNIREFENAIVRACTMREKKEILQKSDFFFLRQEIMQQKTSDEVSSASPLDPLNLIGRKLVEIEKIVIDETIAHYNGNKTKAAKILGIAEKSIYNKLKRFEDASNGHETC